MNAWSGAPSTTTRARRSRSTVAHARRLDSSSVGMSCRGLPAWARRSSSTVPGVRCMLVPPCAFT
ncbi:hypothetical protein Ksed_22310 [Kytococcus sedentarius DSM 20547]|uniref:Uncharacterized protein n=1 Tax=Kytococcus sedentarius (strain ATCC 14392 / DSM 20547 / JCM 11482 / CCUG 33030 / NBRC 15357 / NCTC 11040 / CCM 314 / 541) TaxID=478801 RepID=C7NLW5_KYTSD|nr:hypothetical protein Ksed_22310 [Kytococcus sedentarius DSM 20547]